MPTTERLEAKGPRGEACIIIRTIEGPRGAGPGGQSLSTGSASYSLATGVRLKTTDDPKVFETLDGSRRFTLR